MPGVTLASGDDLWKYSSPRSPAQVVCRCRPGLPVLRDKSHSTPTLERFRPIQQHLLFFFVAKLLSWSLLASFEPTCGWMLVCNKMFYLTNTRTGNEWEKMENCALPQDFFEENETRKMKTNCFGDRLAYKCNHVAQLQQNGFFPCARSMVQFRSPGGIYEKLSQFQHCAILQTDGCCEKKVVFWRKYPGWCCALTAQILSCFRY